MSAALDAGMTGDAVAVEVTDGRLVAWKPAFGGGLVAEIRCESPIQVASVRAGVLPLRQPRAPRPVPVTAAAAEGASRVRVLERTREDDSDELATASVVIAVGTGVDPADYPLLRDYAHRIGAVLAATRKVTDRGWMPRARQVGITGHSIAPALLLSIGASGKFNHTVGFRAAGTVVAINPDAQAPVFDHADIGVVADWREVLEALVPELEQRRARHASVVS